MSFNSRVSPKGEATPTALRAHAKRKRTFLPGFESLEERITPFKPYTHLALANEAYADVIDNGKITVQQRIVDDLGQVSIVNHEYAVNAELVSALTSHHDYFQAGVIAGDGFPELLMGQSVLHPANMGQWAQHILNQAWSWSGADRPQVLAWAYGFMSHLAGDTWAHTLVNEFSGGAFPDAGDVVTETEAKSNALKHIIVEGYIGDATPGYDGNPVREELFGPFVRKDSNDADPTREFSDDSTPGFEFAAPREFIYQTLVQDGVGPTGERGPLIGLFTELRDGLRAVANYTPGAILSDRIDALEQAQADRDALDGAIDAYEACSGPCIGEGLAVVGEAIKFGFESLGAILEAGFDVLLGAAEEAVRAAASAVFGFYFNAWADDIDAGLQHWSELGLGLTNALFNAQSKRDAQNGFGNVNVEWKFDSETDGDRIAGEYGIGTFDVIFYELDQDFTDSAHGGKSFVENHLMPMLGFPDFLSDIKDVGGEIFNDVQNFLDGLTAPLTGAFDFLNPLDDAITDFKAAAKDAIGDLLNEAFHAVLGVNVEQLMDVLSNASRHMDDATLDIGEQVPLFGPNDHEKLDAYLGITDPDHHTAPEDFIQDGHEIPGGILKDDVTFDRSVFAAYGNAVTLTKLAFLDGAGMDQMISDFLGWSSQGNSYRLYSAVPNANVMTVGLPQYDPSDSTKDDPFDPIDAGNVWLNSIDGSHQWRADANPIFNGSGGTPELHSGNGNFPLWESCLLRDSVFRSLFVDWQDDFRDDGVINQSAHFPDHGDAPSHDRNEITPTAVFDAGSGVLTIGGTEIDDTITLRRAGDDLLIEWDEVRNGDVVYGCGETVLVAIADIASITSNLGAGADVLTLDNSGGLLTFTITHDGGSGVNILSIGGDPGSAIARETYLAGQSTIVIDPDGNMGVGAAGTANGDEEIISFSNVGRIDDTKPVTQLDVFGRAGADGFTLTPGDTIDGATTTRITNSDSSFTTLQLANKTTATVNGLDGADTFTVDLATAAQNLATLKLFGNELSDGGFESDDGGTDAFHLRATPAGVSTDAHGNAGNDTFNLGNVVNSLDDLRGTLTINGGGHAATPTTTFTCGPDSNTQVIGDQINFNDHGDITAGHLYQLDANSFQRAGLDNPIEFFNAETLTVQTGISAAIVAIDTTPAQSNAFVTTQDQADVVTIVTTGANSNASVATAGGADQVHLRGSGAGSIVDVQSGADNDVIRISSNAGVSDDGDLDGIGGAVCIDAAAGAANRLIVSDFGGDANPEVIVTASTVKGLGGANEDQHIEFRATGGGFTNPLGGDGIFLSGANLGADQFTILEVLAENTLTVWTNGDADQINVGSMPADDGGDLDLIAGLLTLDGGVGVDEIHVNDRTKAGRANYTLTPNTLVNFDLPPSFVVAGPLAGVVDPPRPLFAGIHYESAESLRLDGTDDVNIFDVKPSLTTTYHIDGNLPPPGSCQPGGGDYLALDTTGTTGRKLHLQALGQGFWSFTSGHQPVSFESIERFNHVDVLAVANDRGLPFIDVYDAETRAFLYRVQAYESFFRGGVRVATGDVNCDGLPDVVAVPGSNRAVTVRAFSGAPDAAGNYGGSQLFEFNAFPPTFKKGAFVAVGDVSGDGPNEIIVGADGGWLPRVAVFDGTTLGAAPALFAQFNAFVNSFRGGVRVAAGDVTGDGRAEIIAASGPGMVGTVSVFNGAGLGRIKTLRPLGRSFSRGLFVAAGDVNADGVRDLIATADVGWLPAVAVYSGAKLKGEPRQFLAFTNTTRTGVRVAAKAKNGGNPGFVEAVNLVFATGPGAGSAARRIRHAALNGLLTPRLTKLVFAGAAFNGIHLG